MIDIKGLSKAYGSVDTSLLIVLKNIHLSIKAGEFVAIMGPSGSGKSTLLNIIACLDTFDAGEYHFNEQSVAALDKDALAKHRLNNIGFVFQSFNLLAEYSALENVELPMLYNNTNKTERRALATERLSELGLAERLTHKPNELSGGQQQRVAIARALVNDPALLIADEPTGSLDTETGIDIMRLFQKLHSNGKTIVMVTHEEEIAAFANRVVRMRDGKIVKGEQPVKSELRS